MPPHARDERISRRSWLLASLAFPLFGAMAANSLGVSYDGDSLCPVAPNLHFLSDKSTALDRLKDADSVSFAYWLQLFTTDRGVARAESQGRFVVSYDILEERFKVSFPGRSKAGLTAMQAEAWTLGQIAVSANGLPRNIPFYLRLELRAEAPRDSSGVLADSGISLRALAEYFSRKAGPKDPHWGPLESGPMRLSDLARTPGRGGQ